MPMPPIWYLMESNTCSKVLTCLQPRKLLRCSNQAVVLTSQPKLLTPVVLLFQALRWHKTQLDISGLEKKSIKNFNALWLTSGNNLQKQQRHSAILVTTNSEQTQLVSKSLLTLCWRKDKPKKQDQKR